MDVTHNCQWKRAMKNERGFSASELLVGVAILGLVTAMAIPNYNYLLPTSAVKGASTELLSEIQLAKIRAIAENNDYVVTFDTSNNSYSVYDDGDNDFTTAGAESGELIKTVSIEDNYPGVEYGSISGSSVTFAGSPKRVIFYPTGLVNSTGSVYLVPTNDVGSGRTDRQRRIEVSQTGRIMLYRYSSGGWE